MPYLTNCTNRLNSRKASATLSSPSFHVGHTHCPEVPWTFLKLQSVNPSSFRSTLPLNRSSMVEGVAVPSNCHGRNFENLPAVMYSLKVIARFVDIIYCCGFYKWYGNHSRRLYESSRETYAVGSKWTIMKGRGIQIYCFLQQIGWCVSLYHERWSESHAVISLSFCATFCGGGFDLLYIKKIRLPIVQFCLLQM